MDMVCTCYEGKLKCGVHEVEAVNIVAIHYKHSVIIYTCEDAEEVAFSSKLYVVRVKKNQTERLLKS
jgi:hypothetical protein